MPSTWGITLYAGSALEPPFRNWLCCRLTLSMDGMDFCMLELMRNIPAIFSPNEREPRPNLTAPERAAPAVPPV